MTHIMPPFPDPDAPAPVSHPAEEFLLDYAAGATSPAETLMLATHLAYCNPCRQAVEAARSIGGSLFDTLEPARLPPNMLNRTLAAIDAGDAQPVLPPPPSLSAFLGAQMAHDTWRHLPGGLRMRRIAGGEGSGHDRAGRVWLLDAPPGMKLPPHRHIGDEWTVVLSGLLVDDRDGFRVGDFGHRDDDELHRPTIGMEGRCVSLLLVRQTPRYTTLMARLAAPFVRL
jgi:putative transcriptional regulator